MMINKPSVSKYKYTLNSSEASKQISTSGGNELTAAIVTAGGSAASLRIYDSADGVNEPTLSKDAFLISANTGESTVFAPARPVKMKNGIYIELEQGAPFNGEAFIIYD